MVKKIGLQRATLLLQLEIMSHSLRSPGLENEHNRAEINLCMHYSGFLVVLICIDTITRGMRKRDFDGYKLMSCATILQFESRFSNILSL